MSPTATIGREWEGTLPPVEEWPQRPLLLRWSPKSEYKPLEEVAINGLKTVPFETALFKGNFHLAVRYCPNSEIDPWEEGRWCHGKQRKIIVFVSGEFKKRLAYDEVMFGFEWEGPLSPPKGIGLAMKVCEKFSPGLMADVTCDRPYMFNIIAGGTDNLHIWSPGDPESEKLDSTTAHLLHERGTPEMPKFGHMRERAKWMTKSHPNGGTNGSNTFFEPGKTYAFEFYTHLLFMHLFEVHFPLWPTYWKIKLADYFNGQPYPVTARTKSGEMLWSLEVWHEMTAMQSPQSVWRKGPRPQAISTQKPAPKKTVGPVVPEHIVSSLASPTAKDIPDDQSDVSFVSCKEIGEIEDGFDEQGNPVDNTDDEEGGDSCDDAPLASPEPAAALPSRGAHNLGLSPGQGPLFPPPPAYRDQLGTVLWPGKRLRSGPSDSASWASKRKEIPQGAQVRVLSARSGWTEVELQTSDKKTGWIRTRNLSTTEGMLSGPEPREGVIRAKRKRVRATPARKSRRHGPYLEEGTSVSVLTVTDDWVLIVPSTGAAGWLKADHITVQPDTPDAGD